MQKSVLGTLAFNPYAAGAKVYSQSSGAPTIGPVDPTGYAQRDKVIAAKKSAVRAKIKALSTGSYADSNVLRSLSA